MAFYRKYLRMNNMENSKPVAGSPVKRAGTLSGIYGFSLIEVLIAMVILSVALLSLSSVSLQIIGGNKSSANYVTASLLAQEAIEALRGEDFNMGGDMAIGGGDDTVSAELVNCSAANDGVSDPATLFSNPDYAYAVSGGAEDLTSLLTCPSKLTPGKTIRRTWTIKNDTPAPGMKLVTVVVGWTEKGEKRYFDLTTALMGE